MTDFIDGDRGGAADPDGQAPAPIKGTGTGAEYRSAEDKPDDTPSVGEAEVTASVGEKTGTVRLTLLKSCRAVPGRDGSYAYDDANRPRWSFDTKLEREHDYYGKDGGYQCTVRRGRNPDGEKRITVGRKNMLRFKERINPEDHKEWLSGLNGAKPTIYGLPELLAADETAPVFIVEGEKDVETLRGEGLIATCNFGGAGKWRREYGEHLAGRDVVILPDNDPIGRAHAQQVLRSVYPHVRSVKVVELPDLPEKGDVTDWLAGRRS